MKVFFQNSHFCLSHLIPVFQYTGLRNTQLIQLIFLYINVLRDKHLLIIIYLNINGNPQNHYKTQNFRYNCFSIARIQAPAIATLLSIIRTVTFRTV